MWKRYRATIVDDDGQLRSLVPASLCLTREHLILRLNTHLQATMPHLLTGIGIFFTFWGLIIGISGAKGSVTITEQLGRTAALETLLGGAYLAFWTSALGLLLSMLLSALIKIIWRRVENSLSSWTNELDSLIPPLTATQVGHLQLSYLRKNTEQLERFNTDLALSIAEALDKQQERWLQPILKDLLDTQQAIRENQVNFDERLTDELLEKFEHALTGPARSKLENLSNTLSVAAEQLSTSSVTIAAQQSRWMEEMDAVARKLREGAEAITGVAQERVGQVVKALDQTLAGVYARLQTGIASAVGEIQESTSSVSEQLHAAASELRSVLSEIRSVTVSTERAAKTFNAMHEAFAEVITGINAGTHQLQQASEIIGNSMQSANELHAKLFEVAATVKKTHENLQNLLTEFTGRFAEVDRSAQRIFVEINEGLDAFADKVRDFLVNVDKSLATASSTLGQAITDLTDAIDELSEATKKEV